MTNDMLKEYVEHLSAHLGVASIVENIEKDNNSSKMVGITLVLDDEYLFQMGNENMLDEAANNMQEEIREQIGGKIASKMIGVDYDKIKFMRELGILDVAYMCFRNDVDMKITCYTDDEQLKHFVTIAAEVGGEILEFEGQSIRKSFSVAENKEGEN